MTDVSGLQMAGTFEMALTDLSGYDFTQNSVDLSALQTEIFRDASAAMMSATYYIKVTYDINSHISFDGSNASGNAEDDAWDLSEINLSNTSGLPDGSVNYVFPQMSTDVYMGVVVPVSGDDDILITNTNQDIAYYYIKSKVTVDTSANLTASEYTLVSELSYNSVANRFYISSIVDKYGVAQKVYWDLSGATPDIGISDDDIFNTVLDVDANLANVVDASGNLKPATEAAVTAFVDEFTTEFSNNLVESWNIVVNAVPANNQSVLSLYARTKLDLSGAERDPSSGEITYNGTAVDMTKVFESGDKIIVDETQTYSYLIKDFEGEERPLATEDVTAATSVNVYGVLQQV